MTAFQDTKPDEKLLNSILVKAGRKDGLYGEEGIKDS